ncbi:hypothetical protein QJS10_CPA07g00966 [Acorus calamus]|uniref:Uncharacterized protein n=1 Tax=Acorus calamus TaxID=4465 RepID=A0AAV9EFX4_ACOCL|nr:hypothetical protein QJS10_CPA07g00966 [Acorus calamus]
MFVLDPFQEVFGTNSSSQNNSCTTSSRSNNSYVAWPGEIDGLLMDFSFGSSPYDHVFSNGGYGGVQEKVIVGGEVSPSNLGVWELIPRNCALAPSMAVTTFAHLHVAMFSSSLCCHDRFRLLSSPLRCALILPMSM